MLAGPAPEALIGPIASATSGIRVGSGGVMLPHYSPLKVAEAFSLLAGLFGRAHRPRDRPRARDRSADDLRAPARPPAGLARRLPAAAGRAARIPGRLAAGRPSVRAARRDAAGAPLQAGGVAARVLSAERDLGGRGRAPLRVRGLHQSRRGDPGRQLPRAFRKAPSGSRRRRTAVAVWAICAETDEQAAYLAASSRMTMRMLRQGKLIQVPPPEKALAVPALDRRAAGRLHPRQARDRRLPRASPGRTRDRRR